MTNPRMLQSYGFRPVTMYVDTDKDVCGSWAGAYTCSDIEVKDDKNWLVYKCMYCNHESVMQASCLSTTSAGKRCRRQAGSFGHCSHHNVETKEVYSAAVQARVPWKVESVEDFADQAKAVAMIIAKRDIFRTIKLVKDLSLGVLYERVERVTQDCYIYFLRCGNYVKIGSSYSPESRIAQLKKENDVTLRPKGLKMDDAVCIGWIQGARSLERDLHQALNRYRQDGEWFEWNPKVELLVTAMIADELNVKDAILRAIEDPKILENLDHNYLSTNFLEKEIENAEEELESLVNEETW